MEGISKRSDLKKIAEEVVAKYNPNGLSPFPYDNIQEDKKDLSIFLVSLPNEVSGLIQFKADNSEFAILINKEKPKTRQHFTVAHELGHYFLHQDFLRAETFFIDGEGTLEGNRSLYRLDSATYNKVETEANNFAAALIMPERLVRNAWESSNGDVRACAKIFEVSVSAMSIRLERLNLITYK